MRLVGISLKPVLVSLQAVTTIMERVRARVQLVSIITKSCVRPTGMHPGSERTNQGAESLMLVLLGILDSKGMGSGGELAPGSVWMKMELVGINLGSRSLTQVRLRMPSRSGRLSSSWKVPE